MKVTVKAVVVGDDLVAPLLPNLRAHVVVDAFADSPVRTHLQTPVQSLLDKFQKFLGFFRDALDVQVDFVRSQDSVDGDPLEEVVGYVFAEIKRFDAECKGVLDGLWF